MLSSVPNYRTQDGYDKKAISRYGHLVATVKDMSAHEIAKIEALVRFHFKIDPTVLSDDDLGRLWGDLQFALEYNKMMTGNVNPLN